MHGFHTAAQEQRNAVKSQYHCATLVGNWEEERRDFGPQHSGIDKGFGTTLAVPPTTSGGPALPLDGPSVYTESYRPIPADALEAARGTTGALIAEAPRELLFYHGDLAKPAEKHLMTVGEMSFTNPRTDVPYTNDEILDLAGVSGRRDQTATLRRSMGFAASGSRNGEETESAAIQRETALIRSLTADGSGGDNDDSNSSGNTSGGWQPPRLPPVGRVAARQALLTTKNVTIDATGVHLYDHPEAYPLTSSVCVGSHMASKDDPMHKSKLRVDYELTHSKWDWHAAPAAK